MKTKFLTLVVLLTFTFNLVLTGYVLAQESATGESVLGGFAQTGKEAGFKQGSDKVAPSQGFVEAFSMYATGLVSILGAFFLIIIIYSGWLWMTAQGNEEKVTKAKARILAGFIGLIVTITARIVAEVALNALSGTLL